MSGSHDIAADLRRRIDAGEFPPGSRLPTNADLMAEHGVSKATVTKAIGELVNDGLAFTAKRGGTRVRHRAQVQLSLTRYSRTRTPGGRRGPWETATAEGGMDGIMRLVQVKPVEASEELATLLEVAPGDALIYRVCHAIIRPDDLVQLQHTWYPRHLAEAAGIDNPHKTEAEVYHRLAAAGHRQATASETVAVRPPTTDESPLLRVGGRVPLITLERVTRDQGGRPIEVLRTVAAADRIKLTYDDLPLPSSL